MYTYEETCMMNLGDTFTLLYGYVVEELLERYGLDGERAVREGTRRFGRDRARCQRERHLEVGAKINMKNLFSLYPELPADPRFRREMLNLDPYERVSRTLVCPMADTWKAHGQLAVGRIYCEEFHFACYNEYAYGYTQVNLAKTLTQEGDDCCAFNVVLRPQNLPEELRARCFAEYDPGYVQPEYPPVATSGKDGFNRQGIKLYFHLLQSAVELVGEAAAGAVGAGLERLAKEMADILRASARGQERRMDQNYLADNIPFRMNPDGDPCWQGYTRFDAPALMKRHFCDVLQRELALAG